MVMMSAGTIVDIFGRFLVEVFLAARTAEVESGTFISAAGGGFGVFYWMAHYGAGDFVFHNVLRVLFG